MCGIAGYIDYKNRADISLLSRMLYRIRHRGPDECGIYTYENVGLGNVRLSIIDLANGQQPMPNQDLTLWITFNGEIFNYIELKKELEEKGHQFRTKSDTEILVHLYEEYGAECLSKLNGQFAFTIWDKKKKELFLARDRVGIRPLFYYFSQDLFVFGSEIKAIFEHPEVSRSISLEGLSETFTFWTTTTSNTVFENIRQCPPGHYMIVRDQEIIIEKYWELSFSHKNKYYKGNFDEAIYDFNNLLKDSINIRLRADVPVAAYLSGGLDSSVITSYIKNIHPKTLRTFSIGFTENEFDESVYQKIAVKHFNTEHYKVTCNAKEIANNIPDVVWYSEIPILRTSPSPMLSLSKLVRSHDIKVVMTGEGADELLAGYNIFKETVIRHFWSKFPQSKIRPLLLKKLYPYITSIREGNSDALRLFYRYKLNETNSPVYSHLIRWKNSSNIIKHLNTEIKEKLNGFNPIDNFIHQLDNSFNDLDLLAKAQFIEISLFMSGYLLSSQGDRMAMANSVEGRYPFLDHRIIEFSASLPPDYKLRGLNEKILLKRMMKGKIPEEIVNRPKQAYRAPILSSFVGNQAPEYVNEVISPSLLKEVAIFDSEFVSRLYQKMQSGKYNSEVDNMALTAIITTQLLYIQFIKDFRYLSNIEGLNFNIRSESNYKM